MVDLLNLTLGNGVKVTLFNDVFSIFEWYEWFWVLATLNFRQIRVPRLKYSSAELFVTDPKENYVFDFYRNPKPPRSFRKLTPISKIFFEKDSFKPM